MKITGTHKEGYPIGFIKAHRVEITEKDTEIFVGMITQLHIYIQKHNPQALDNFTKETQKIQDCILKMRLDYGAEKSEVWT